MERPSKGVTILLIEDDLAVTEVCKAMLEAAGFTIRTASNGQEGIESQLSQPADIVITDIVMPNMNGLEVISALKKVSPETRIIAISGEGIMGLAEAEELGVRTTILKPVEFNELLSAVNDVMSEGSSGA